MKEYTTETNRTFGVDHEANATSVGDNNLVQVDHSGDSSLPDMNQTVVHRDDEAAHSELEVGLNSHSGIDHHYLKAIPYWTKEGHWFPKRDYSQIRYQVYFGSYIGYVTFTAYVNVQRGADPVGRYLRFYYDGVQVGQEVMYYSTHTFTFQFDVWFGGTHTLTVEVYWGGYRDYGWKLSVIEVYALLLSEQGYDYATWNYRRDLDTEFFPKASYARLEFDVFLGPNSWAYIKIDSHDDTIARFFWIYVDGVKKNGDQDWTPLAKSFYLGDYSRGSLHKLRLEIYWGGYKEYGWKLDMKTFKVYYDSVFVEVDYMSAADHNHAPSQSSILSIITDYYHLHGHQNLAFVIDDDLTHVDNMWPSNLASYRQSYFDHKGDSYWRYLVVGHYSFYNNVAGYQHPDYLDTVFVADQYASDVAEWYWFMGVTHDKALRDAVMHEIGHTVGIVVPDANGEEVYCPQPYSVMAIGTALLGAITENNQEYDWEH
jgi:hypothetical protein